MRPFRTAWLALLLAACAPALLAVDPGRLPEPEDWDPKPAQLEWWYTSGWAEPYAFHFAFFKAYAPPSYRVLGLPGGGGQLRKPGAQDEPAAHVAGDQSVVLEGGRKAVRGQSGEARGGHEPGQGLGPSLQRIEQHGGLVDDPNSTGV